MARATLELEREAPGRTREILAGLPGVTVRPEKLRSVFRVNGTAWPLVLIADGLRPFAKATALLASLAGPGKLGLVVAERLPEHVKAELERAGCAYADATGAAHVDLPGFYLHVAGHLSRRKTQVQAPAGLGVTAVRTIQTLLTDPARQWSVAALAEAAACSTGEAHKVLTRLQAEGLVIAQGRARTLRRSVADPGGLLDWLSTVPSARRIRERQLAFLYATDPQALATTISAHAVQAELRYAFTGTAAAHIYGATVTTAVPVTTLRIDPKTPLADAAIGLRAEPVDSGHNLVLVRDLGEVGIHGRQFNGPAPLAPPVRIWLDILDDPRGEDAASLFREAVIGW